MKKIITLHFVNLKNSQHFNIMDFMKAAIVLYNLQDSKYAKYVTRFLAAFEAEDIAYQKYDRKTLTARIANQNVIRQAKFRLLREIIHTFIRTAGEQKRLAAERLMGAIDLYGGAKIPTLPMDSMTGVMTNLLDDFYDKYSEDVELLGIGGAIQNFKAENDAFKELISERTQADSELGKEAMALARAETDRALRMLFDAINLDVEFGDADPSLEPFIAYVNTELERYRIQIGQGVPGSSSSSSGSESEDTIRFKTATFRFANGDSIKRQVEVGTVIIAPDNTFGYVWNKEIPELMPNKNLTFHEVPIEEAKATATFHFLNHTEEKITQVVGTPLVAPANTEGCVWEPEVPAIMPEEDTVYYEKSPTPSLPSEGGGEDSSSDSEPENPGGGNNGDNNGTTTDPDDPWYNPDDEPD